MLPLEVHQRLESIESHPASDSVRLIEFDDLTNLLSRYELQFSLPGAGPVVVDAVRIGQPDSSNVAWSGVLRGIGLPMFFIVVDGDVGGMIHTRRDVFRIKPLGAGYHVLVDLDPSKFGPTDPHGATSGNQSNEERGAAGSGTRLSKSSREALAAVPPVIDLLVAYTPNAAAASGNIGNLIASCEQSTNEVLSNSGVSPRVEVVHSVEVNYEETQNCSTAAARLQNPNDGHMDNVHALRDQYGADVVVLLVNDDFPYLGWAYDVPAGAEDEAFCAVYQGTAVDDYTFAHEVSHLVGARHAYDPEGTYEHARVNIDEGWRTVVANEAPTSTSRIPYLSNPNKTHPETGTPLGTVCCNDNARKWETRASTVAGFKQPQPPSVSIAGPDLLGYKESGTWNANVSGGAPPYTYEWRYRYWGTGSWSGVVDTDSEYTRLMLDEDFELKCTVTSSQDLEDYDTHYVYYGGLAKPTTGLPRQFALQQNYPNPFNPTTEIRYQLPQASWVVLSVFNVAGQRIRSLAEGHQEAGYHVLSWDGKDDAGKEVASGMYLYRIEARPEGQEGEVYTGLRKMILLR